MSFFDDPEDQPTRRVARPRRPAGPPPGGSLAPADSQTLLVRRAIAAGVGLLVLLLIVLGINSCLDSRKKQGLKDYNRDAGALAQESDQQVAAQFFALLGTARGKSPLDVETQVNSFRVEAEQEAKRARNLKVPGDMKAAERNLVLALDLRMGALQKVAARIRTALGSQGAADAVGEIAGEMQSFLASDVIYSQRVVPLITETLDSAGIGGQTIYQSHSLPNLAWLSPTTVANRLRGRGLGGKGGAPAPGTHGHGLVSVAVGTNTLTPGATNRIAVVPGLAFQVKFANQGQNDEVDVVTRVKITGTGKPITVSKRIDQSKAGTETTASIPLTTTPPIGTPVTISIEVVPVPGEMKTDNNKQTYTAIFTRG